MHYRYLAGDALQRLGVSFEASTKIAASLMRTYCEEVEQLGRVLYSQSCPSHLAGVDLATMIITDTVISTC